MHSPHRRPAAESHPPVSSRREAIRRERARPRRRRNGRIRTHVTLLRPLRASFRTLPAVIAATLMFTTYALPAYAEPPQHVSLVSATPVAATQIVTVADSTEEQVVRDSYSVALPAPVRVAGSPAGYLRVADTFANDAGSPVQWPFDRGVPITSWFGYRVPPCATCSSNHSGVDFAPGAGTPIQAIADGVVSSSGNGGELGVNVAIEHVVDGERITSVYGHMLVGSISVKVGDSVTVGQIIGQVGDTGESTGPHLHLTLLRNGDLIDPFEWLKAKVGA